MYLWRDSREQPPVPEDSGTAGSPGDRATLEAAIARAQRLVDNGIEEGLWLVEFFQSALKEQENRPKRDP